VSSRSRNSLHTPDPHTRRTVPAMLRSRPVAFLALAVLAGSAAGCGVDSAAGGPSEAGPTLAMAADASRPPVTSAIPPERARATPALGKWFSYKTGLRVRIGSPERFRPSSWIEREPGVPLAFTVEVVNRTGEEWNPSQLHVRLQSGFTPAIQIYDAEKGIVARPEQRLADGRSLRFRVAYWAPQQSRLTLELSPGFGYQPTLVQHRPD
jgi:hypothetical protein